MPRDLPDHVHHKNGVEDNEEVVCVPEYLIVGHAEKQIQNENIHNDFQKKFHFLQTKEVLQRRDDVYEE